MALNEAKAGKWVSFLGGSVAATVNVRSGILAEGWWGMQRMDIQGNFILFYRKEAGSLTGVCQELSGLTPKDFAGQEGIRIGAGVFAAHSHSALGREAGKVGFDSLQERTDEEE